MLLLQIPTDQICVKTTQRREYTVTGLQSAQVVSYSYYDPGTVISGPFHKLFRSSGLKSCKVLLVIIITRGQFWPSGIVIACVCVCVRVCVCQSVCQSLACPRDNLGPVQARIAKFGPKMQKTLVKVPIVLGGNWPWPSRSNLTSKSEFTPFWACPDHNSSPIQVRITKFGPEVENSLVNVPIILGGNWPWPSRSNLI